MNISSTLSGSQQINSFRYGQIPKAASSSLSPNKSSNLGDQGQVDHFTRSSQANEEFPTYKRQDLSAAAQEAEAIKNSICLESGEYNWLLIVDRSGDGSGQINGPGKYELQLSYTRIGEAKGRHALQDEYDRYNEKFDEIYSQILTERGLMPSSGRIGTVPVDTQDIDEVFAIRNEVFSRVASDPEAARLIAKLGIELP